MATCLFSHCMFDSSHGMDDKHTECPVCGDLVHFNVIAEHKRWGTCLKCGAVLERHPTQNFTHVFTQSDTGRVEFQWGMKFQQFRYRYDFTVGGK